MYYTNICWENITRSHVAYGTAERMFLQFFEGMMTLFYLVGKCVLGWYSFVF